MAQNVHPAASYPYMDILCNLLTLRNVQAGLIFNKYEHPPAEEGPLEKIQLEHLILPFIILIVGLTSAVFVFALEVGFPFCKY